MEKISLIDKLLWEQLQLVSMQNDVNMSDASFTNDWFEQNKPSSQTEIGKCKHDVRLSNGHK